MVLKKCLFSCIFLLLIHPTLASGSTDYRQGIHAFREGDFLSALEHFEQAEAAGNSQVTLFYNLGSTHYQLNNLEQASDYFSRISDDEQWGGLALYNLGIIAEDLGQTHQALAYYHQAATQAQTSNVQQLAQAKILQFEGTSSHPSSRQPGFIYIAASLSYDDNLTLTPEDPALETFSGTYLEALIQGRHYLQGNQHQGSSLQAYLFQRLPQDSTLDKETAFSLGYQIHWPVNAWESSWGISFGSYLLDQETYTRDLSLQAEGSYSFEHFDLRLDNQLGLIRGGETFDYLDGWQNRTRIRLLQPGHWELGYQQELNQRKDFTEDPQFISYSPTRFRLFGRLSRDINEQLGVSLRLEGRLSLYPDPEVDGEGNQASSKRQDWRWRAQLGGVYRLNKTFSLFAELQHLNNRSNLAGYDYSSNQLQIGLDAIF
ncbi:Putative beta-barrel porin 2 [Marinospirillum celere]|uniref:Putative beta-barrel porin 2 n=1 Tax=Marinospirillum celere TaxID=1122252 RepID=A0A1I1HUC7_9GAMM|nr:outer membrane beta-barrel protein [Marinospirillum celere]SFC27534.1 Putative beta-barrel porin 2 [Marinospirillum celere]